VNGLKKKVQSVPNKKPNLSMTGSRGASRPIFGKMGPKNNIQKSKFRRGQSKTK
jgi:hypothetical protein